MEQKHLNQTLLNAPLKIFLEMCLWEKGIDVRGIDEDIKEGMLMDLAEDFFDYLWQAFFSLLNEEDLPHWKQLMESNPNTKAVESFFRVKLPDFDGVVENTMAEFKNIYVSA